MTKIKTKVERETFGTIFSQGKEREVIVTLQPPNVIGFRLKGSQDTYYLTTEGCYMVAIQAEAASAKRARKAKR